jgi:hypothetical protein
MRFLLDMNLSPQWQSFLKEKGPTVHAAIVACHSYLESGALVTVTPGVHRVTILPLRSTEPD